MHKIKDHELYRAIYEATYDAWLAALGRDGLYPITTAGIHQVIAEAVEKAVYKSRGSELKEKDKGE